MNYWEKNKELVHITPAGINPEGFDPISLLSEIKGTVLDFGCGNGRMVKAFKPEDYIGTDINSYAIKYCTENYPEYHFDKYVVLPTVDNILCYTVLLHISDDEIEDLIASFNAKRIIVVEIMDRGFRREGDPPVYNRNISEYIDLFKKIEKIPTKVMLLPYNRYGGVNITYAEFN